MKYWEGQFDTTNSWFGATTGTYNVGGGIRKNTAYIENDSSGIAFLANSATKGSVRSYIGGYYLNSALRQEIEVDTTTEYNLVHQQYASNGGALMYRYSNTVSTGGADYYFNDNTANGLALRKVTNSSNAITSFLPLNFFTTTTTNVGQILAANSNYSNAAVNLSASSFGVLANVADLSLIAGVSGKAIRFTVGGYSSTSEVAVMTNQLTQIKNRLSGTQGADVASVAGTMTLGTDGNVFEITGTNAIDRITNTNYVNGSEITLLFTSTASLTDGTANSGTAIGMELNANTNFTGSAGASITLTLSEIGGTQRWREKCRSVN